MKGQNDLRFKKCLCFPKYSAAYGLGPRFLCKTATLDFKSFPFGTRKCQLLIKNRTKQIRLLSPCRLGGAPLGAPLTHSLQNCRFLGFLTFTVILGHKMWLRFDVECQSKYRKWFQISFFFVFFLVSVLCLGLLLIVLLWTFELLIFSFYRLTIKSKSAWELS